MATSSLLQACLQPVAQESLLSFWSEANVLTLLLMCLWCSSKHRCRLQEAALSCVLLLQLLKIPVQPSVRSRVGALSIWVRLPVAADSGRRLDTGCMSVPLKLDQSSSIGVRFVGVRALQGGRLQLLGTAADGGRLRPALRPQWRRRRGPAAAERARARRQRMWGSRKERQQGSGKRRQRHGAAAGVSARRRRRPGAILNKVQWPHNQSYNAKPTARRGRWYSSAASARIPEM